MGGHPPIVNILNMKEGNKYTISMGLYERGGQRIFNLYFRKKVKLCERGGGDDPSKKGSLSPCSALLYFQDNTLLISIP